MILLLCNDFILSLPFNDVLFFLVVQWLMLIPFVFYRISSLCRFYSLVSFITFIVVLQYKVFFVAIPLQCHLFRKLSIYFDAVRLFRILSYFLLSFYIVIKLVQVNSIGFCRLNRIDVVFLCCFIMLLSWSK